MKIAYRYLLSEMIPPFLFGLIIFTTLLLSAGVLFRLGRIAAEFHPPLSDLLLLFWYSLPRWVAYALPLSVLLAGLLALGRLSQDLELLAFKALGIPITDFLFPLLLFGTTVSLILFLFQETFIPPAQERFEKKLAHITKGRWGEKENVLIQLQRENEPYFYLFAKRFHASKKKMEDVFFMLFDEGLPVQAVRSKEAGYSNPVWVFRSGILYQFAQDGKLKRQGSFSKQSFQLPLAGEKMKEHIVDTDSLSARQLRSHIAYLKGQGLDTRELEVDFYWHFAIPVSCVIFSLFCLPFSLLLKAQSHALGLGLSGVVTFFYYVIMNIGNILGKNGILSPFISAFLPDLFFLLLGLFFLKRANR